jgi:hypothetical protein
MLSPTLPAAEHVPRREEIPTLRGVGATAWLTLAARARATRAAATADEDPALAGFSDTGAHGIAASLGLDVSALTQDAGFVRGAVLRTMWFDRIAWMFFAAWPESTAITLGAGLCTRWGRLRPRLPRPHSIEWLNIDLPEVVAWRDRHVPPGETEGNLACSILDTAWLDRVGLRPGRPVVVFLEGVCPYLPQAALEAMLSGLAARFDECDAPGWLVLDFIHPALVGQPMQVGGMALPVVSGLRDVGQILGLHASMRLIEQEHPFPRFSAGHQQFEKAFRIACGHPPYTMACLGMGRIAPA